MKQYEKMIWTNCKDIYNIFFLFFSKKRNYHFQSFKNPPRWRSTECRTWSRCMRTVGRPREYLEILGWRGPFVVCFYWEVNPSFFNFNCFFENLFFFTWFKSNEFFFPIFLTWFKQTNYLIQCDGLLNWSFESCLKVGTKLDGCFSTDLWSSQSGTYVPSTLWKHFHWWINKSTEINLSQQKSTNIKPTPRTGPKPEKFLSSESGRCPKGLQCLRTLMWNRGPPWASRWNGKHQQLMVRHIWVGSGRDINNLLIIHILLDIPWYDCPYSDCFYMFSMICFLFFIFLNLLQNGLPQIQVVVLWLPMLSHRQRVQRVPTCRFCTKNLKVLYWKLILLM